MSFQAARWAEAYMACCDAHGAADKCSAEAGLELIKAVLPVLGRVSGRVYGTEAAVAVSGIIGTALRRSGVADTDNAADEGVTTNSAALNAARGVLFVLIKRNLVTHGSVLIEEIEKLLDRKAGILTAVIEGADSPDDVANDDFLARLGAEIASAKACSEVRFVKKYNPALLGGYRVTIGSERTDYSIAGSLAGLAKILARE
jgi:hypothetical protein